MLLHAMSYSSMLISFLLLIAMITVFAWIVKRRVERSPQSDAEPTTVDDYIAQHGEPEAMVLLDATRSNELNAVVLIYDHELVVNGESIDRVAVTDITFNNASNPYVNCDYQMVLTTTLPDSPVVRTPIGSDAEWASEVTRQLAQAIQL